MTPLVLDEAIGGRVVDAYNKTGRPVPISIPGDERQFEVVCISDLEPELTEQEKQQVLSDYQSLQSGISYDAQSVVTEIRAQYGL